MSFLFVSRIVNTSDISQECYVTPLRPLAKLTFLCFVWLLGD